MRLWSISPVYLDPAGLVALWRESLLALHVLRGETRGYRNHPQLERFKMTDDPVRAIGEYLHAVADEADIRGYRFDRERIIGHTTPPSSRMPAVPVTSGQIDFERAHLMKKLRIRDPRWLEGHPLPQPDTLLIHPSFKSIEGPIAERERPGLSS